MPRTHVTYDSDFRTEAVSLLLQRDILKKAVSILSEDPQSGMR